MYITNFSEQLLAPFVLYIIYTQSNVLGTYKIYATYTLSLHKFVTKKKTEIF